jgi:hypothetical protein
MGADNLTLVCNPREATKLRILRGPVFEFQLLSSPAIPSGTVIACVPTAIASGYEGLPEIETTKQAALHFEDTSPQPVPAAPTRSLLQQQMIGLRVKVRCTWAALQPGAVQFMTGVKW